MSRKNKQPKNQPRSGQKDTKANEEPNHNYIAVDSRVIDILNDLKNAYKTSQTEQNTHNGKQLRWTQIGAGLVLVYAGLTLGVVCLSYKANQISLSALRVSQRSYVTVGRKDGTVAEFITPKDPKDSSVGLVVYFQNSGHLPATFNWGIDSITAVGKDLPVMKSFPPDRRFTRLTHNFDKKTKSMSESLGETLAGGSLDIADVIELDSRSIDRLSHAQILLQIRGTYEYCDGLGTYSCQTFSLYYTGAPYDAFRFSGQMDCLPNWGVPKETPTAFYVAACDPPK